VATRGCDWNAQSQFDQIATQKCQKYVKRSLWQVEGDYEEWVRKQMMMIVEKD
jgi:hypothetical protein